MRLDNRSSMIAAGAVSALVLGAACGPSSRGGAGGGAPPPDPGHAAAAALTDPREVRLGGLRQLTFGGENAEAYWSHDGTQLIMQSKRPPYECDQIFRLDAFAPAPKAPELVSNGKGRTTCSYFFPGDQRVLFSSTHLAGDACPPTPDMSQGYVWPLYKEYDIFTARPDGSELTRLTDSPHYDAEATTCPLDGSILFTSTRDGDLELYRMDADGKNLVRLTSTPGYDGGAFFSRDCKKIVWRASRPAPGPELEDYQRLLAAGLVRPSKLELFVANSDGSDARQVTYLDAASFAPYFTPDGKRILFSSNYGDPRGREFDIWAINVDGSGLERITFAPGFDGFPMFSPDGKTLAFSSNRNQKSPGDTDVYVATWVADAAPAAEALRPGGADRVRADVAWLADDAREGRGVGTKGLDASAEWLARRYAELGLEPGVPGYLAEFPVTVSLKVQAAGLTVDGQEVAREAFAPLGFSSSTSVKGAVVVAGFGISAPELGHDDYKKLNVKGKVVVVRRFTPEGGKFTDEKLQRRYGDLRYKAWNAREHGAIGLVIVDAPVVVKGKEKEVPAEAPLPQTRVDAQGDAGLPVVVVNRAAGTAMIDGKKKPREIAITVGLVAEKASAKNVVGVIRAGAPGKQPGVVVIGAHYDHLGLGEHGHGSLAPDSRLPHNGADDNASGTAALLEVARELVARKATLERDVWIVAFSAEEMGVLGSSTFVKALPAGVAAADLVGMLNMDMVGRLRDNHLSVLGGESAEEWKELVVPACTGRRVACTIGGSGYGPSDHTPFYAAGVPVLHFFSGAHADYHKPTDDAEHVNAGGVAQVALVVADVAVALGARGARLTLKAAPAPEPAGDRRSFGASLGTVPDYAGPPAGKTGVLLAGVRPGSAAEKAGMRRGDLLIKIGASEIRTIEDFMFVLRKAKPGEKTTVTVERDGQPVTMEIVYGSSGR